MRTATAFLVLALAGAGAFALAHGWGDRDATLLLPTTLGDLGLPGGAAGTTPAPVEGVTVSPPSLSFGALRPSRDGAAVELRVQNAGVLPVEVRLAPSALVHPATGASIPADAVQVVQGPSGASLASPVALVPPGGATSLWVRLAVPSGATQWVPAGAYHGSVALTFEEVRS